MSAASLSGLAPPDRSPRAERFATSWQSVFR